VPERPRVLLVTSGDASEGRGHLGRATTLAEELSTDGTVTVTIAVLRGRLGAAQVAALLGASVEVVPELDDGPVPDAVVVDLPDPAEVLDRWPADRLIVFDDGDAFAGDAAVVIQPSMSRWSGRGRVDTVLAGYGYAPIRPGLRRLAATPPPPADPPEILVCFGGSDPFDVSSRLVPAIANALAAAVDPPRAAVVAIVGADYRGALAAGHGWPLLRDPADLDRRLAGATLAVLGGGTMKLEAACLGVPALLVAAAPDQLAVAPAFVATGAARYLGDGRTIDPRGAGAAAASLLADEPTREAMARAGRAAVDGRGAERIAAAVLDVATGPART
jgi:spore coat polysaccharide biosynthesis predicted glycosyltransferase SpsG